MVVLLPFTLQMSMV
uniref:Uncharacterized protein n=1 Tax=Rhizophora mucronata TaxID=61149 RepID=A0A2P2QEP3_RHIMU